MDVGQAAAAIALDQALVWFSQLMKAVFVLGIVALTSYAAHQHRVRSRELRRREAADGLVRDEFQAFRQLWERGIDLGGSP